MKKLKCFKCAKIYLETNPAWEDIDLCGKCYLENVAITTQIALARRKYEKR